MRFPLLSSIAILWPLVTLVRGQCFPAIGFQPPATLPSTADVNRWWCDDYTEYAFLGFSYEVTQCQSRDKLKREFLDMRNTFKSRYVRLYGACDRAGFYDDIVEAAWTAGLGVHALIWFGFDGSDTLWRKRRDVLFAALRNNPRARFVTRVVQFGSEPLYDWAIEHSALAEQVRLAKSQLADLRIKVTVSEMAYGYQARDGAQDVLDAVNSVNIHILPYWSQSASTASNAWPIVTGDLNWFLSRVNGKKIYFSQNGWPSEPIGQANSPLAVANLQQSKDYYALLNNNCPFFKSVAGGGVGWFWHIYSDEQQGGYGLYDWNGNPKFNFRPKLQC